MFQLTSGGRVGPWRRRPIEIGAYTEESRTGVGILNRRNIPSVRKDLEKTIWGAAPIVGTEAIDENPFSNYFG